MTGSDFLQVQEGKPSRKRNSVVLTNTKSLYDPNIQIGEVSRYRGNSLRKSRRFSETFSPGDLLNVHQTSSNEPRIEILPEAHLQPNTQRQRGGRRSSVQLPQKPDWSGQRNPVSFGTNFNGQANAVTHLHFDIPQIRVANVSVEDPNAESKYDPFDHVDPRSIKVQVSKVELTKNAGDPTYVKKGSWTEDEDDLLRKYGGMAKTKNWTEIAEKIPGRSPKQCRERWCFNLDPAISKELWAPQEDLLVIKKQKEVGNKWAQIAQLLPGRTENAVKTRFKSILRAQRREWHPSEDERLLQLYQQFGANWERISVELKSHRTKHAVKMRYKEMQNGLINTKLPEYGSARQTVREAYYPARSLYQVSERYKALTGGALNVIKTAPSNSYSRIPSFINFPPSNGNVKPLSFVQPMKQEPFVPVIMNDPLDELFLLYEEDPLVLS